MYYCSILFAFLTLYGISADKETVQCTPSLNSSIVPTCTITSNQAVLFNCSLPDSFWYRNGSVAPLCSQQSICELPFNAIGYSETAGLYYCADNNKNKYFVNIKVLGSPPEFVSTGHSPVQCIHPTYCEYERLVENIGTAVMNFSVKVIGTPPFTVAWMNGSMSGLNICMHNATCLQNKIKNDTYLFSYYLYNPKYLMSGYMYVNVSNDYGYNVSRFYYEVQCKDIPTSQPLSPVSDTLLPQPTKGDSVDVNCSLQSSMVTRIGICYFNKSDTNNINQIIKNEQLFNETCALCTPSSDDTFCKFSKQTWEVTTEIERDQNDCNGVHLINVHIPDYQHNYSELRFQCFYQENDVDDRKTFKYWIGFDNKHDGDDRKWFLWFTAITVVLPVIVVITVIVYCARKRNHKPSQDGETDTINTTSQDLINYDSTSINQEREPNRVRLPPWGNSHTRRI